MKKWIQIIALAMLLAVCLALPLSAQKTDYQIGETEGGLLNDGKVKDAFQKAVDKFKEWTYEGMPSGYVTREDDYYLQTYTDKDDNKAAVYVGPDYGSYVLRGPIYQQLDSLGGLKTMGRPVSDAYQVKETWYQNFENGYATVSGDSGKATFIRGSHADEQGKISPITATTDTSTNSGASSGTSGSDGNTMTTDTDSTQNNTVPSPSEMVSDVVSDVEEAAPKWGMWIFIILLLVAIGILVVYWFLKKR